VILVVTALVVALSALSAPGVSANEIRERIGSARRGQSYYESVMLQADRALAKLDRHHDRLKRDVKRAGRQIKRTRSRRADARSVVHMRERRVLILEKRAPGEGEYVPKGFEARLRRAQARLDRAERTERRWEGRMRRVVRTYDAKDRKLKILRRTMRPTIRRRESAEGALAGLITSATRLAQQQAQLKTVASLGPPGTFVWPTLGSITQAYGCTGYAANPRRGSCRHFHDGLDISPSAGTRIGTVATGVIAYVGWNPWDTEGRAFIVVVGHADGYVSRYGHLLPNRRVAHAGQFVYRGETLGYMGSTGNSTGVHLHFEVLRYGSTVDPRTLLPDRDGDRKGKDGRKKDGNKDGAGKQSARKKGDGHATGHGRDRASRKAHRDHRRARDARADARRADRRDGARGERGEARPGETDATVIEPSAGEAGTDTIVATCEPSDPLDAGNDGNGDRAPTLSDLADQLRRSIDDCEAPTTGSTPDPWGDGTPPWDLATLDPPRMPSAR
jgi:murein DD-endopeptidase MepM/ murein hydrolase activator NlpD